MPAKTALAMQPDGAEPGQWLASSHTTGGGVLGLNPTGSSLSCLNPIEYQVPPVNPMGEKPAMGSRHSLHREAVLHPIGNANVLSIHWPRKHALLWTLLG